MSDAAARLSAVFSALLLAGVLAAVFITSNPQVSGTTVNAEFDDVYPLLPGMHVRVDGAVAGSVREIEVSDEGKAEVTMTLNEGTSPPRADASAAVRQQDITGDSYVALDPGSAEEPLGETPIASERTIVAPRFDDLLDSFNEPVRQGLELTLIELGKALERRGDELNRAVLELRPGLGAANEALAEVRSQNAVIRDLIADAEAVTGQAAGRSRELGRLVDSLSATLQATAAERPALDAALAGAPALSARARQTLAKLTGVALEARPIAQTLADSAPELERTLVLFAPFLDDAEATMDAVGPTLVLVDRLLTASLPTLREAPSRVLTAPLDIAAAAGAVLDALLGERELQRALFSADGYGQGKKAEDDVGLGAIGVEQGTQAGYEGNDPERRFLRAEPVLSCEVFGLPIRPGCLLEAAEATAKTDRDGGDGNDGGAGPGTGAGPEGADGAGDGDGGSQQAPPSGGSNQLGDALEQSVDETLDGVEGLLDNDDNGNLDAVEDLLDFLVGS